MSYEINELVAKMGEISIEGNIIPNEWYIHLRNEKSKIQTNAALILADIVYWYRPIPIYDIKTGELVGHGKKFKEDLLQINYKYFNDKFGFSENQTRNALIFLEEKQLIFREFRDIVVSGHALNNVMYIGIYPEKISKITNKLNNASLLSTYEAFPQRSPQMTGIQLKESNLPIKMKVKDKDWSTKFTDEQKEFLFYLLNIKPEVGDPIEKNHATWWIKHFGIEKIKIALQVYWQRIEKAKQNAFIPMPQHMGKYVRKALNDGILPDQSFDRSEEANKHLSTPYLEKSKQVVEKFETGLKKNETTNTQISMISMSVNEVNDNGRSLTFQKEERILSKKDLRNSNLQKNQPRKLTSSCDQESNKKVFAKSHKKPDWTLSFTLEEKKYLSYLIHLQPEKGNPIEEKHATWWIKDFGIEKIKIALQVYQQQVEKARKNTTIPMPTSMGAYVRNALNKGTQPCRENDHRNKTFAEQFKREVGWSGLTITEKYCRVEVLGKEWHYNLPKSLFIESLKSAFESYCSYTERSYEKVI